MEEMQYKADLNTHAEKLTLVDIIPPVEFKTKISIESDLIDSQAADQTSTVPDLADVMDPQELEAVTQEGLEANPLLTAEQETQALERAAQLEAYQKYLEQQHFMQFMMHRPKPATANKVHWGLVLYELVVAEKDEFNHMVEIQELNEHQWYHGIVTGNIKVHVSGEGDAKDVSVELLRDYIGRSTQVIQEPRLTRLQRRQQMQ